MISEKVRDGGPGERYIKVDFAVVRLLLNRFTTWFFRRIIADFLNEK